MSPGFQPLTVKPVALRCGERRLLDPWQLVVAAMDFCGGLRVLESVALTGGGATGNLRGSIRLTSSERASGVEIVLLCEDGRRCGRMVFLSGLDAWPV